MRIARLETADGPRYAIRAGEGWAVVEDCFADPPILTGVTVSDADALLLAPCEPRVLVGIAHNKTNNDHPLPIQAWHKSVRSVVGPDEVIQARRDVGTVNRGREHRLRGPMGAARAWRCDPEWLTEHLRRGHSGRHGRDHAVPDRLTQQPCHLTKILREMRTP
jgi:uncharacterized protein DUF2437